MTREEKVLKAFWKKYDEAKKSNIIFDDNRIRVFEENQKYCIASIELDWERKENFFWSWSADCLKVEVWDRKHNTDHRATIFSKKEIKNFRRVLEAFWEHEREKEKKKEEESLNSLL